MVPLVFKTSLRAVRFSEGSTPSLLRHISIFSPISLLRICPVTSTNFKNFFLWRCCETTKLKRLIGRFPPRIRRHRTAPRSSLTRRQISRFHTHASMYVDQIQCLFRAMKTLFLIAISAV